MKPVVIVVGTRPEIVKMAPIVRALKRKQVPFLFVHCGQHYDYNMSGKFIEDLELPKPDYTWKVAASSPGKQTAKIMSQMDGLLSKIDPSIILVEGDTNTVLAASLAANKRGLVLGHVEAGLRSYDLRMPEEHNRRLTDHISNYLFAPTEVARENLVKEGVWGKVFVTGNTVIDAVNEHLPLAEKKSTLKDKIPFERFAVATAHRAENVDSLKFLKTMVEVFSESPIPIIYPMHPRTKKRLEENNLFDELISLKNLWVCEPLGYLDFLYLMSRCNLIITDSGGIQEEATAPSIRKPVLVVRLSTERQEAVKAGFAKIVGTEKEIILSELNQAISFKSKNLPKVSPFGGGKAAERIIEIIAEEGLL